MTIVNVLISVLAGIIGFGIGWAMFSRRLAETGAAAIRLQAEKDALAERLQEQPEQAKLMASVMFEELSGKFSVHSEKKISDLLDPLKNRINDFQKLVTDSFATQGKEQYSLKNEIEKIVLQADSLAKALRGDVKAQGDWGEIMLERILEASGLQKNVSYFIQGTEINSSRLKPDVVIKLPDSNHIIVDSKVSLTAYDRYCSETDELAKAVHLKEFLKSIRNHVSGLADKNYPDIKELGSPDLVLMFMPMEGAFSLAVQNDLELHPYAWGKRVAIVCPSTLIIALKTIASLWRIEKQNKNAEEIAKRGGALYDKFSSFIDDMQNIGASLEATQKHYTAAFRKLHEGPGNLLGQTEKLKSLGAKTSKSLPRELLTEEEALEAPSLAGVLPE
jgi:DNA recombination protein RmuC